MSVSCCSGGGKSDRGLVDHPILEPACGPAVAGGTVLTPASPGYGGGAVAAAPDVSRGGG